MLSAEVITKSKQVIRSRRKLKKKNESCTVVMKEVETREMAVIKQNKRYGKKVFITSLILFSFRYKLISPYFTGTD